MRQLLRVFPVAVAIALIVPAMSLVTVIPLSEPPLSRPVPVTLPTDATEVKQTKDSIKFTLPKGKGKAAVENLRAQFKEAGWKEDVASVTGMSGALHLSKEGQSLSITYSDTGFLPTEISLSAMRAELERR